MDEAAVGLIEEESGQNVVSQDDHEEDQTSGNEQPSPENSTERDGVFCCQKCGDAFREEATYLMHLQQHSQESDNTCQDTPSTYEKDAEMNHETTVHDLHSQDDTENSEVIPNDLSEQMDTGINRQQPYQCEECGKSYEVFGYFLNHQRSHRQASKSVFHNLEHLQKKSFQCEFCGRSYSRASALDAHRRCHEGKLVKKSRNSPESLGSDHRTEDKSMETPTRTVNLYGCSCGKTFATLLRLKTHKRFSRNGRCTPEELFDKQKRSDGFQCTQCNKTFSGYTALASHVRWHNPDNVSKFRCEECDKTFKTLTFFQRHQRLAHTQEIASKSFLHQVCQLQKKSFECKVCGLKFSRASALHSHELNHSDVYNETVLPQTNTEMKLESETTKQTEGLDSLFQAPILGDGNVIDTEDEEESLEPGDLIVKVISSSSSSESEDNTEQDENSDLELVCESDYEVREDGDLAIHQKVVSKPNMNLKIVQIDYGEPGPATEDRHDCPDCYRWFTNPVSLRVHRMWHDVRRRRQVTQAQRRASGHLEESQEADEGSGSDESALNESDISSRTFYKCKLCDKLYFYLHAYKKHKNMHELERVHMNNPFDCPVCGCAFPTQDDLISHRKLTKTCSSNLRCDPCNKNFASALSWSGHLKLHEERPFWCFTCAKGFTDQSIYKNHMYLHKCRRYSCTVCNKRFLFMRQLKDHYNLHTGEKPHICTYCGKAFSHSATLYAHKKTHHMISPFKSRLKSGWTSKQNIHRLNKDEKRQLQTTLQTLSKADPQSQADHTQKSGTPGSKCWEWECCDCDMGFDEISQLHSHYIRHATGEIPMLYL
ncbi:zinc finger protein 135 isoform X3 [Boleophthalmus pectinirostris]|uniref:zinc finger protein 135 isoform X3 n=1 Tax=Boleophthalmus pectinirostris TaxID=150288 RepID=UPI0024323D08|nr:zinc finger protein 135 isoform X3 [Boleophthalmus pectinirostris]